MSNYENSKIKVNKVSTVSKIQINSRIDEEILFPCKNSEATIQACTDAMRCIFNNNRYESIMEALNECIQKVLKVDGSDMWRSLTEIYMDAMSKIKIIVHDELKNK